MLTDFETFKKALLDSGYKVFRDQAPKNTPYPYLIYSYIGETQNGLQINLLCLKDYIKYRFYKRN